MTFSLRPVRPSSRAHTEALFKRFPIICEWRDDVQCMSMNWVKCTLELCESVSAPLCVSLVTSLT